MKDENKKYAQVAYDIVTHAAKKIGSRLPGSDNEKKYADYMGDKLREIGIEPKQEEFAVSPRSSIGGIPYAGYAGLILSVLSYFALKIETLWFGMAFFGIAVVVWLVFSVFLYKTWFDMFFRKFRKTHTVSFFRRTVNMITPSFFPAIRTQAGPGAIPSMHINISTSPLSA